MDSGLPEAPYDLLTRMIAVSPNDLGPVNAQVRRVGAIELLEQGELRPAESRRQIAVGIRQSLDAIVDRVEADIRHRHSL